MLGPGILFFTPAFSTGYAFQSCRLAKRKLPARIGLVIALVEVLALALLVASSFVG